MPRERISLRIDPGVLAQAREKAAADGFTLTDLVEDGLRLMTDGGNSAPADPLDEVELVRDGLNDAVNRIERLEEIADRSA